MSETPLTFGIAPAHGIRTPQERVERIAAYLTEHLGRPVRGEVVENYASLGVALADSTIDAAWLGAVEFARAHEQGVHALATSVRAGEPFYGCALIVRRADSVSGVEELSGTSAAWVDPHSAAGYVYPRAYIEKKVGSLDAFFKDQQFLGSHRAVCEAVVRGWARIGGTYCTCDANGEVVHSSWTELLEERSDEIRVLAVVDSRIPGDAIAARPGLPADVSEAITAAFLALQDRARELPGLIFAAEGFVAAREEYYEPVLALVRGMNVP